MILRLVHLQLHSPRVVSKWTHVECLPRQLFSLMLKHVTKIRLIHEGKWDMTSTPRPSCLLNLGCLPYEAGLGLQRQVLDQRVEDRCLDSLILVEHEPVFTLGKTSKVAHWGGEKETFTKMGIGVYENERGGSVTYHGPGQIVGYPILRLHDFCPGPKVYVRKLEEVLIRTLGEWSIQARRVEKWRGVWVEDSKKNLQKIAAMGVRITRGVTMHGFALNVNVDLKPFELITPCGIEGCQVTSMAKLLGQPPDLHIVRGQIAKHFAEVFGLEWKEKNSEIPNV